MRRFALFSFCFATLIVIAFGGRPGPSQSATSGSPHQQAATGNDAERDGLSENLFALWRALADQQPPHPSAETITGAGDYLLRGDYIFSSTGAYYDFGRTNVQSAIGGFTFDGRGNFTGFQQSRTFLTGTQTIRFGGTYSVDASGVGLLFYLYPTVQTHTVIVVKGGDAFFFVDVNSSSFREAGYARRLN
ncbi:MAG: hypothetical protein N0A16_05140 [Blastocatellia bacterium]|nr:hypothetical protein [Blastocatellia bacterium]MCS7157098.1 hypothetical protein [Blastocatellia bacterium]MCX7752298.1 hypothetical protein [Blastocatellia bacterium]MDW8167791.1 hypothetical protein [Acidobacteriota bacterium]MDW8255923.1 hypothetical protein [Acidobacteriota bacterium]